MARKLLDDCFLHDKDRLTHSQAIGILKERVMPVAGVRHQLLEDAFDKVLAETITATRPIPGHDNAAVDGYAFSFDDYNQTEECKLEVTGRAAAGHPFEGPVVPSTAIRIFTGAVMPEGLDTIVMQEDVDIEVSGAESWIRIPPGLKQGANRRLAGEDVEQGGVLLDPGARLRPQDIAAIASTGRYQIACFEPLKVAVFSTGDEVVRPGRDLRQGQVYDANSPMLQALIRLTGAEAVDLGILPDDANTVKQSLETGSKQFDAILTSGGASRGDEDYVVETLNELGNLHMWQIAVKPGRPMSFGQIGDCIFAGLPGNPVAVFVCFLLYVRPILVRLSGGLWPEPARYRVKAAFSVDKKKTGRREFWRGKLKKDSSGELKAEKFKRDGSGLITSLREADGLIEIDEDADHVKEGDEVSFIPFSEFGIRRS